MQLSIINKWFGISLMLIMGFTSCENKDAAKDKKKLDTLTKGEITVAVDDHFQQVMSAQYKVFDSSFPEAKVNINFIPQEEAMHSLFVDSARMAIVGRGLSDQEKKYVEDNKLNIRTLTMAIDAVAVIVNNQSVDSYMTLPILTNILKNQYINKYDIIFDNSKSGIVKYIKDKLIPNENFPSNTYSLSTIDSVIGHVAKNKNAIGFVPASYVYNKEDGSRIGSFINSVKVVALESDSLNEYYLPFQPNLFAHHYPLTRPIYFHLKENYRGLGTGFANFLCQERGQTIFYSAKMLPTRMDIAYSRETILK